MVHRPATRIVFTSLTHLRGRPSWRPRHCSIFKISLYLLSTSWSFAKPLSSTSAVGPVPKPRSWPPFDRHWSLWNLRLRPEKGTAMRMLRDLQERIDWNYEKLFAQEDSASHSTSLNALVARNAENRTGSAGGAAPSARARRQ